MNSSSEPTIVVSAAVIREHGRYLITLRPADAHCGDLWEFPGGKVDPGETPESCLVREIREELGMEIEVLDLLETISHRYPDRQVLLHFFRCSWRTGAPVALGCAGFAWVLPGEFTEYPFPEADARFLEKLKAFAESDPENRHDKSSPDLIAAGITPA
jgi:mutator protein MutT